MNITATRSDAHVVPSGSLWAIKMEGIRDYSGHYETKLEATAHAMHLARFNASSVVIHGQNGRIQTVWSYDAYQGADQLTKDTI